MNEIQFTQFQIRPYADPYGHCPRCMFKGECFSLSDIVHISPVMSYEGINHYKFIVKLLRMNEVSIDLQFDSPTKAEVLRWQRELARAWTRTGEFSRKEAVANEELLG